MWNNLALLLLLFYLLCSLCVCAGKKVLSFSICHQPLFFIYRAELSTASSTAFLIVVFVVVVFVSSCSPPPPPPPVPVCSQFMLIKQFTVWYPTFSASPSSGGEHYGTSISHHQSDTNRPSFSAGISAVPGNNVAKRRERETRVGNLYGPAISSLLLLLLLWYWACNTVQSWKVKWCSAAAARMLVMHLPKREKRRKSFSHLR